MRSRRGQSILEYVIVLTVIVVAIALVSTNIRNAVSNGYSRAANSMQNAMNRLP